MRLLLTQNSLFTAGDTSNKQLLFYNNINSPLHSKELGQLPFTVEHNYICFITRSLHVSALYVGHHQVVVRLSA